MQRVAVGPRPTVFYCGTFGKILGMLPFSFFFHVAKPKENERQPVRLWPLLLVTHITRLFLVDFLKQFCVYFTLLISRAFFSVNFFFLVFCLPFNFIFLFRADPTISSIALGLPSNFHFFSRTRAIGYMSFRASRHYVNNVSRAFPVSYMFFSTFHWLYVFLILPPFIVFLVACIQSNLY